MTRMPGEIFCFRGRRGDLVKLLWHDGVGMSLYAKRLEAGKFIWPAGASGEGCSGVCGATRLSSRGDRLAKSTLDATSCEGWINPLDSPCFTDSWRTDVVGVRHVRGPLRTRRIAARACERSELRARRPEADLGAARARWLLDSEAKIAGPSSWEIRAALSVTIMAGKAQSTKQKLLDPAGIRKLEELVADAAQRTGCRPKAGRRPKRSVPSSGAKTRVKKRPSPSTTAA